MSDFDENWQLKSDAIQAQSQLPVQPVQQPVVQAAPVQATPVQSVPVQPVQAQQAPVQAVAQPVMPVQPQYQQPVQPQYQQPVQPVYQAPIPYSGQQMAPSYGYPAQPYGYPQQQQDYAAFAQAREAGLVECQKLLNHFSPKVDLFQKYENCNNNIKKYAKTSIAPLVWGIIVALLGLFFLFDGIFGVKHQSDKIPYYVISGIMILAAAGLIVMFVLKKINHKKKKEDLIKEAGELSNQLTLLYNGYGSCPLKPEFVDPRIIYKLQSLIMQGRCSNVSEALNIMFTFQRNYPRIESEKNIAAAETSERYEGKPAYFNAVSYFNLR